MTLPIVRLAGTPYAQGLEHGRALRDRVAHNLQLYFGRFEREVGLSSEDVHAIAGEHSERIARSSPRYAAAMAGVAEGSGFPLIDIAALNVRYEILYYLFGQEELATAASTMPTDGCTAFAALPQVTASGHLLIGQNWDWIPDVQGAVLHTRDEDGLETLAFTEAGIVGAKIGLNSAGLGLCINGMTTVGDDWARPVRPFHLRCYDVLRSRTLDDARRVITDEPRAIAANFLIAQAPDGVLDIEAAPDKVNVLSCTADSRECLLTHANHFVDPESLGVEETPNPNRPHSKYRAARLAELLNARLPLTVEGMGDALRDTQNDPYGVCRHADLSKSPDEWYVTVTSVIMDLEARALWLTDGAPDVAPYDMVALSDRHPAR